MGALMQPHPCLGPYLREVLETSEEAGRWHLAAFAREQWERHVFGGVYESRAYGPDVVLTPVPACQCCEETP